MSKQNPIRRHPARKIPDFSDRLLVAWLTVAATPEADSGIVVINAPAPCREESSGLAVVMTLAA